MTENKVQVRSMCGQTVEDMTVDEKEAAEAAALNLADYVLGMAPHILAEVLNLTGQGFLIDCAEIEKPNHAPRIRMQYDSERNHLFLSGWKE